MVERAAAEAVEITQLYRRYRRHVYRVALLRLGRAELAEEATQETMLRAWRAADRLDGSRPVLPWLLTIAHRVSIDIGRYERRRPTVAWPDLDDAPAADELGRVETAVAVHAALAELAAIEPEAARQLWLCHAVGYTYAELSAITGRPTGTMKSRAFRAHRTLAALLDGGA